MAKYWLSYKSTFKSLELVNYAIEIYDSELTSDEEKPLVLAASPLVVSNTTDDITSPIKALVAKIRYVNDGTMPLTAFYSENDSRFKLIVKKNDEIFFIGFLVQDDCSQTIGGLAQVITLQFTDNLGLLKNITLSEAAANYKYYETYTEGYADISDDKILTIAAANRPYAVGNILNIGTNTTTYTYTIQSFTDNGDGTFTFVLDKDLFDSVFYANFEFVSTGLNAYDVRSIFIILNVCLQATGMVLNSRIFSQLIWDGSGDRQTLASTRMLGGSFYDSNEKFDNCYQIITDILGSIGAVLTQRKGYWYIVRKPERLYNEGDFIGYEYDGYLLFLTANLTDNFDVSITDIQADGIAQIVRPYEYVQRDFKFVNPPLIVNSKFTSVGDLIGETSTLKKYNFPISSGWVVNNVNYVNKFIKPEIHVVLESTTKSEIDRKIKIQNSNFNSSENLSFIQTNEFLITSGDLLSFNIEFEVKNSPAPYYYYGTLICIFFKKSNGKFVALNRTGSGIALSSELTTIPNSIDNLQFPNGTIIINAGGTTTPYTCTDFAIPFDCTGFVRIYPGLKFYSISLPTYISINATTDADYNIRIKDFSSKIVYPNDVKIVSQTNKANQTITKKSNLIETVKVDDSPRTSFAGTLFKSTGTIPQLTTLWNRGYGITEAVKLGNIITFEKLFFNRKPRTKYDFTLLSNTIEPLSILTDANKLYLLGRFDLDCENDTVNCTAYELMEQGEERTDLTSTNTFNYNYE